MAVNLPLPNKIAQSSRMTSKFSVLSMRFGNGYEQVKPDGRNPVMQEWSIVWQSMTQAERDIIVPVLFNAGAWTTLLWQPPGSSTVLKFRMTASGYSESYQSGSVYTITTQLTQVF